MHQASRRAFVVGAFFVSLSPRNLMKLHSLAQLHSYRGRRSGAMPFGRESWCPTLDSERAGIQHRSDVVQVQKALATIASVSDAVRTPTNRNNMSGGLQGTGEGSIPSSTTAHLN